MKYQTIARSDNTQAAQAKQVSDTHNRHAMPGLHDQRPTALAQTARQLMADSSTQAMHLNERQAMMQQAVQRVEEEDPVQGEFETAQRVEEEEPLQGKFDSVQRVEEEPLQGKFALSGNVQLKEEAEQKPNNTGLPDQLKTGIESLSGISMDHVKVHYNSSQPAQLNALAYAQGSDIHVAPGQEQHLAHEAWHVVQQAQGRVKPTMQMKQGVPVNDDVGLESEADVMGAKAMQAGQALQAKTSVVGNAHANTQLRAIQLKSTVVQMVTPLVTDRLNVVGEEHPETEARLAREKRYTAAHAGSANYWSEAQFRVRAYSFWNDGWQDKRAFADPFELRFNHCQQFLANNANIIRNDGNSARADAGATNNLESQSKFIKNLWVYLGNLDSGFFTDQTDGFEVPALRRTEMLGYRQQVKDIAVTWQAARVALAGLRGLGNPAALYDWTGGGVVNATQANERASFKASVDALGAVNIVARTVDELSADRSDAMHVAANARATELGVWKIGEAHRAYLTAKPLFNYNLVSRGAFNTDYNTWVEP